MEQSMNRYIGQMLDDRYEILEIIGSGGMSVVYKAMCHKLHRYVAVKILRDEMAADAELKNRFQRHGGAALRHADLQGAAARARPRHRPPGHQAAEHHDHER